MIATALFVVPLVVAVAMLLPALARPARRVAVATGIAVAAIALAAPAIPVRTGAHIPWASALGLTYAVDVDSLASLFVALAGIVSAIGAASSERVGHTRAYHAVWCLLLASLVGALVSRDLGLFFVFWEAMVACAGILIWRWGASGRTDAAQRFMLTALIGSALYLVVIASLAVARGSLDIDVLRARPLPATGQLAPAALLSAAFVVMLPMLPFHSWLPRAFVAAPRGVSLMLATATSAVALYALVRIGVALFPVGMASAAPAFVALAAVGTLYGAAIASRQDDVRRLLGFASISTINVAVIGVFAATDIGLRGALLSTVSRSLALAALIALAGALIRRTGSASLSRAGGLSGSAPWLAALTTLGVCAIVGIPGTSGFAGDFLVFAGSYERFPAVTAVTALVIVASAVWAASLLRRAFQGPPLARGADLTRRERAVIVPLLVLILVIGVAPRIITDRVATDALLTTESGP